MSNALISLLLIPFIALKFKIYFRLLLILVILSDTY